MYFITLLYKMPYILTHIKPKSTNINSIFTKRCDLRNGNNAAHPNQLLQKAAVEFAVSIIVDTLMFIKNIGKTKNAPN